MSKASSPAGNDIVTGIDGTEDEGEPLDHSGITVRGQSRWKRYRQHDMRSPMESKTVIALYILMDVSTVS